MIRRIPQVDASALACRSVSGQGEGGSILEFGGPPYQACSNENRRCRWRILVKPHPWPRCHVALGSHSEGTGKPTPGPWCGPPAPTGGNGSTLLLVRRCRRGDGAPLSKAFGHEAPLSRRRGVEGVPAVSLDDLVLSIFCQSRAGTSSKGEGTDEGVWFHAVDIDFPCLRNVKALRSPSPPRRSPGAGRT